MDMKAMMKQAQRMQKEMAKAQEEVEAMEYSATAGGGMVKAVVSGKLELTSLEIDPEAVDPEDVEMLSDMVMVAVNEAYHGMKELSEARMSAATGGMGIPGLM